MNEEMNNNIVNNETNSNNNYEPPRSNNGVKVLLSVLIILAIAILGLFSYKIFVVDKKNDNKKDNNVVENKDNNENEKSKILSLADFPLKDDQVGENGILYKSSFLKIYSDINNIDYDGYDKFYDKELIINVNNIAISIKHSKIEIVENGEKNKYEVATLKLGDTIVYEKGSLNPYLIITDKYIIIRNNVMSYYNSLEDQNLDRCGEIYIYNYKFDRIMHIENVNTYDMIDYPINKDINAYEGIDKFVPASGVEWVHAILNGSLDIAIKDNILYYIVINNNLRYLKYVNLSEKELEEKTISNFKETDAISRNQNIESIMQFPLVNETINSNVLLNSTFGNICTNLIPEYEKIEFEKVGDAKNFKYNNVQYIAKCTHVVKDSVWGNYCDKMTLKINNNEYSDLDDNPVMIVTTNNIIISPQPRENETNKIYVLDKSGVLLKTIDDHAILFYNVYNDKKYSVGGNSSLAIYNNVLYYVVLNNNKYELRGVDLKSNNIVEKTIEVFDTK